MKTQNIHGNWPNPAVIATNNFVHKSLSNWAFNLAVGCNHGCTFCYVPSAATNKMAPKLRTLGVTDPDAEWGEFVFLRQWDEKAFMSSLLKAERTPLKQLRPDGNRAVFYCSTTDAYQVFRGRKHNEACEFLVRRSLELIRDHSSLNVRILTRCPLAKRDFDIFHSFGPRLTFGMSLPTLRNDLSKVYERKAPAPTKRLETLRAAKDAGLHVFVAMAPTFPECDETDLYRTLETVAELDPLTVFHEPINIRAENVARIAANAERTGISLKTEVFASRESWRTYALSALTTVERLAGNIGLSERLHLWPDKGLGSATAIMAQPDAEAYLDWLTSKWSRISEWPAPEEP